jgi:hypothetical protein
VAEVFEQAGLKLNLTEVPLEQKGASPGGSRSGSRPTSRPTSRPPSSHGLAQQGESKTVDLPPISPGRGADAGDGKR